jgi:hypothetical protein
MDQIEFGELPAYVQTVANLAKELVSMDPVDCMQCIRGVDNTQLVRPVKINGTEEELQSVYAESVVLACSPKISAIVSVMEAHQMELDLQAISPDVDVDLKRITSLDEIREYVRDHQIPQQIHDALVVSCSARNAGDWVAMAAIHRQGSEAHVGDWTCYHISEPELRKMPNASPPMRGIFIQAARLRGEETDA